MPRPLFLTESFHPVLGGGEEHIRRLGKGLVEAGLKVCVLTRKGKAGWPEHAVLDGIEVRRVPPEGPGRTGKYRMVPAALRALRREREAFDLLVVRGTRVLGLPGLLAGRALGKPVVLQAELNGEMSGEAYTWGTALARPGWRPAVAAAMRARNLLLRDADAFVAMSRLIREEFLAAGLPEQRVHLIPHGVDTERFRPASPEERSALRRALGLPPDALVVTYTGRLLRGKGLETLMEAFLQVESREPRARLVLVGSGAGQSLTIEAELRRAAHERGRTGSILFTGRVENVEAYLRAADVFAFPSVFEALGLSLIEATACGLPCVGSRTGGIVDVIEDESSGFLVNPGEAEGLAGALTRLLGDAELRRGFGERARALARSRFDARDSQERYLCLFQELAVRTSSRPRARALRADAALLR